MKVLLVFSVLVGLALSFEPVMKNYHEDYGIPRMAEIKAMEEALDFDGARIAGGSTAAAGAQPHLIGLVIPLTDGRTSVCGACMLSNNRAVTAAHCWRHFNNQARQFTLVFGSATLMSGGTRVTTTNVQMHQNYNQNTFANDIAMIVHNWVGYNNLINRILIPSGGNSYYGTWAQAAGFGRTNAGSGNSASPIKHHIYLQVITNAICWNTFGNIVTNTILCTSGAGGIGVCPGDSGGPLAIGSGNNRQLIGITSFVHRDGCNIGFPAGFTRVTSFAWWIQARM